MSSVEKGPDPQMFANEDSGNQSLQSEAEPERDGRSKGGTSLKDRMNARQSELESRTTEIFPVPRYDEVMAVELKAIAWEKTEEIVQRHSRQTNRQMLNSAADEIVVATVAFHEIKDDAIELIEDVSRWSEVAKSFLGFDPPQAPYATRERICLLALCSDQGVMALNGPYRRWLGGANTGISGEVRRDFNSTR